MLEVLIVEDEPSYLDALKITVIRQPGYEADDIIGTLAYESIEEGFETWMVTPDCK